MAKFHIKWSSGKEEAVEQSDCATIEQFVNTRFGSGVDLEANGVEVTLVDENAPEPEFVPVTEAETVVETEPESEKTKIVMRTVGYRK